MLPGNAKCSVTSLADTKYIFMKRLMAHRILQLAKITRGYQTTRALRARRDYKVATLSALLIIQNRFHLLLKYFSIRNSLRDVPSAPLFVDAVSIFVACAVEFQVGVLAPGNLSVSNLPLRGLTIRHSCVCCSVCMRNGLRFTDSKHCFADDEKTALHEYFGH